jgi:hypothetical protein
MDLAGFGIEPVMDFKNLSNVKNIRAYLFVVGRKTRPTTNVADRLTPTARDHGPYRDSGQNPLLSEFFLI